MSRIRHAVGTAMPLALWLGAAGAFAADPSPRAAMRDGRRLLQDGKLPDAAAAFDRAAQGAPGAGLDPARARFNQSLALQGQEGKDAEVEAALDQALRTTDVRLQARALYNRGELLTDRAKALQGQQKFPEAVTAATQALSSYGDSLLLDSADDDARVNYELTGQFLEELQQQAEQQKQQQQQQQDQQQNQNPDQKKDSQDNQQPQDQPQNPQQDQPKDQAQPQSQPQDDGKQAGEPKPDAQPDGEAQEERAEDMSKEEAQMLLDAMKAEEAAAREKMRLRLGRPVPVDKDW